MSRVSLSIILLLSVFGCFGQKSNTLPAQSNRWTVHNRNVSFNNGIIHLDASENDGILWLNGSEFKNGTIELDIKGKDLQGQSFVGIAFHGLNDETFDGVYFRPFNFRNEQRKTHSVQYISMPQYDWSALRETFPGKYENTVNPVPDPNDWFHARIEINYPSVKVYVNNATQPSLEVEQISDRGRGGFGLWVGNGSEGWFRNIMLKPSSK